ncbi:hypothetical protein MTY59_48200 [Mycobacterium senriense]|uniref:Uncharacterized protein n=2 Tax=Mycobacterium senriense TaxID=2775496 RepID=A0ABM7SXM6_9MYCO|nr:hypothetical protein MTY59_48200 [Mycobacterium senriense]
MFDYMLRYFQLAPVDCLYYKYPVQDKVRWVEGSNAGYLAVVCRAVEDKGAGFGDSWLSGSVAESWEYLLCNQRMMDGQRRSRISYQYEDGPIDLRERVNRTAPLEAAPTPQDTSLLRLADRI